jgi:hypothetical protein
VAGLDRIDLAELARQRVVQTHRVRISASS